MIIFSTIAAISAIASVAAYAKSHIDSKNRCAVYAERKRKLDEQIAREKDSVASMQDSDVEYFIRNTFRYFGAETKTQNGHYCLAPNIHGMISQYICYAPDRRAHADMYKIRTAAILDKIHRKLSEITSHPRCEQNVIWVRDTQTGCVTSYKLETPNRLVFTTHLGKTLGRWVLTRNVGVCFDVHRAWNCQLEGVTSEGNSFIHHLNFYSQSLDIYHRINQDYNIIMSGGAEKYIAFVDLHTTKLIPDKSWELDW